MSNSAFVNYTRISPTAATPGTTPSTRSPSTTWPGICPWRAAAIVCQRFPGSQRKLWHWLGWPWGLYVDEGRPLLGICVPQQRQPGRDHRGGQQPPPAATGRCLPPPITS